VRCTVSRSAQAVAAEPTCTLNRVQI